MVAARHWFLLAPKGLAVEHVDLSLGMVSITARPVRSDVACPSCGTRSAKVRSRYWRTLADLPAHGRRVLIRVRVRRFCCSQPFCCRKIFAERLDSDVARPFARRTGRLESIAHHIGLLLGGRPGQGLARRLDLPISKDTLLRIVRRRAPGTTAAPAIIGIDDWAWKRRHLYGTVVCDLERRCIVDLLPDRDVGTVEAWLAARPSIQVVARDRGGAYGAAATRGRPQAMQVADRWHLMENASAAFLMAVRTSMRAIRHAVKPGPIDPARLTSAERLQYECWQRRAAADAAVLTLARSGTPIKEIVRRTGRARKVVRRLLRGGGTEVFRPRQSSLTPFLERLEAEWTAGCRNGAELWRRLQRAGFQGCRRVVTEWATRRRADDAATIPWRAPTARSIAHAMTVARDRLSTAQAALVATIEAAVPALADARVLLDRFQSMIRRRDGAGLETWLADTLPSLMGSFASGIAKDRAAVQAGIVEPWSNGQTEGQITKLKLVKRQMYGRAKLDLLRARLLPIP